MSADAQSTTDISKAVDGPFALVLSGDSNADFGRALAVTIRSTLAQLAPACRPTLYFLDCGVDADTRARLGKVVRSVRPDIDLRWVAVDQKRLDKLPTKARFPLVVYSRLLVAELLPPEVTRAVFLDGDLLVRRDLSDLFVLDLETTPVAAVQDLGEAGQTGAAHGPYFNAGVMVMDLSVWRQKDLGGEALRYAGANNDLPFQDQDALNRVIPRWLRLEPVWNLQVGGLAAGVPDGWITREELTKLWARCNQGAVVVHFTVVKPWLPAQGAVSAWAWIYEYLRTGWDGRISAAWWTLRWLWGRFRLRLGTTPRRLAAQTAAIARDSSVRRSKT